jgi:ABC-type transport system involved in cytochrome c biogenesis permease subunit
VNLFRNRTTDRDGPAVKDPETRAEVAEAEAREAERVEAAERAEARTTTVPRREVVAERPHPIAANRAAFGGVDFPASVVGMLTALATLVLLGGLIGAAIGAVGYQTGLSGDNVEDIGLASLIGGIAVIFVAYLIGGWTAGRIARYDGARNGLMTGVWTLVLAAILSALAYFFGNEYDVLRNVDLPQWFDRDAVTTAAIVSGVVTVGTMLLAGLLGGVWGSRYHRVADESLLDAHTADRRVA